MQVANACHMVATEIVTRDLSGIFATPNRKINEPVS